MAYALDLKDMKMQMTNGVSIDSVRIGSKYEISRILTLMCSLEEEKLAKKNEQETISVR